ncbi:trypsin-like peptidase domain-containing protein [Streptomyces sp. XM4193]|uniref:trypsin-like peptidase domain-containing protein n=1 Tax=Streptomyces sp. XM4193 TaxID=2929782 RepID=UPI001FFB92CE|nr:trypsin-like peptidase domain-containing protein [Streptomyces sp. XM4193]MCK1796047.1 trypsin-like peptidase domain-containing protein [Streptomyces sp. XM4193]
MDESSGSEPRPKWWNRPRRNAGSDDVIVGATGEVSARDVPGAPAEPEEVPPQGTGSGQSRVPAAATPLHPEDPYGTPPYGGPGPWALAPPVQHPRAQPTPAHGVPVPPPGSTPPGGVHTVGAHVPPTPAHGTAVPPHGTPAHGVPGGTPSHGTPAPGAHPHPGTPAHGTGVPPAPPVPGTPAHGTGVAAVAHTPQHPGKHSPGDASHASHTGGGQHRYDPWAVPGGPGEGPTPPTGSGDGRGPRGRTLLVGALLVALLAGAVGGAVGMYVERNGGFGRVSLSQPAGEGGDRPKDSVAGIAASTLPGVVTLHVRGGSGQSTGTGFVLDDKGHILTNHHVVRSAAQGGRIGVTFNGGETVRGRLVGGDGGYDLAVVKVDRVDGLRPLPLGNSESVQVGDPVVAIGSPFDLAGTVTTGIISAKERPVTAGGRGDGTDISYVNALQTDAPINPGNSGGPLVDTRGRVVGVNTAIRSGEGGGGGADEQRGGSVGLGFAIPVNQAKRVAEELINDGRATHPVIGVSVDIADQSEEGARVGGGEGDQPGVVPGGPADDAGMKEGDLITAVDGARVRSGEELIVKIRSHKPGDELELTVERGGKERSVKLTLGSGSSG